MSNEFEGLPKADQPSDKPRVERDSTLFSRILRDELTIDDAPAIYEFLKRTNNPVSLKEIEGWINEVPSSHLDKIQDLIARSQDKS